MFRFLCNSNSENIESITLTKENSQNVHGWFSILVGPVLSPSVDTFLSDWSVACSPSWILSEECLNVHNFVQWKSLLFLIVLYFLSYTHILFHLFLFVYDSFVCIWQCTNCLGSGLNSYFIGLNAPYTLLLKAIYTWLLYSLCNYILHNLVSWF